MTKEYPGGQGKSAVQRKLLRADIIVPLAIALATFLVFSGALRNGFVNYDDDFNFLTNPHYRGLGWAQIRWMFTSSTLGGHYMPLTWLTLGLDFVLWGMNPFGYHLTNLLLHCANAAVFYFVSRRLLASADPRGDDSSGPWLDFYAALASLFFALHPLRVESVSWITERRDVLSGFFYLLAILFYLRAEACAGTSKGSRQLALSVVSFACSLLSKISGITLPLTLLVIDIYPLRRLPRNPKLWFTAETRRVWLEKIPFLLLVPPAGLRGIAGMARLGTLSSFNKFGAAERFSIALFSAAFYVWKTFAPWGLSPFYTLPDKINPLAEPFLLSCFFVAAITVVALAVRRRWPAGLAVWTCYLIAILPVSGLAQNGLQIAADRYTYIPCLGFALLAAGSASWLHKENGRYVWRNAAIFAGVLLGALSCLTWRQIKVWHDSEAVWNRVLSIEGDIEMAHYNLGHAFAEQGKMDEAIKQFNLALQAKPDDARAHNNLGLALAEQGKMDEAIGHYNLAIQSQPDMASAHYNLAQALAGQGKIDEAVRHYNLAIQANPNDAVSHNNLGSILAGQGKMDEAVRHYSLALQARPDYSGARFNLGLTLAKQGKTNEAIAQLRQTLQIDPGYAPARGLLAFLLKGPGQNR